MIDTSKSPTEQLRDIVSRAESRTMTIDDIEDSLSLIVALAFASHISVGDVDNAINEWYEKAQQVCLEIAQIDNLRDKAQEN